MTIASIDDYLQSVRQLVVWCKTASRTTIAAQPFSLFDIAGNPGAGVLNVGNTANGIVPTDAIAGYPNIAAFGIGATGYLTKIEFGNTIASRFFLYDRLFSCGAYAYNANTALSSQPSFLSRLPNSYYGGLEIWVEQVTAATGNLAVNVTYTDQDGNTGATTGAVGIAAAPTVGRMWQLPLASGDYGVRAITNVVGSVATAGTFNVHVLRPIYKNMRVRSANDGDVHDFARTGSPIIYENSALFIIVRPDSTSSGVPEITMEIANL